MLDKTRLLEDFTKEELVDMLLDLHESNIRKNKEISVLIENCERFENKINQMKKEVNSL